MNKQAIVEYIDLGRAIGVLLDLEREFSAKDECTEEAIKMCRRALSELPTISPDSLVKRGRWKNIHIAIVDTTGNCTVCGQEAVWRTRGKPYANCPNCGALMED